MQEGLETRTRDRLDQQRTELANERTLPAYVRTALGFMAVGGPAVWWLEGIIVHAVGVVSLDIGAAVLGIGLRRFVVINACIGQNSE